EATQENEVTLNEMVLTVADEANNIKKEYPIRESYREKQAQILTLEVGKEEGLIIDQFIPRAIAERRLVTSPLEGVGAPSLKLELFNSRFNLEEAIVSQHPSKPTEVNLGPALISFQVLHNGEEQKKFFQAQAVKKETSTLGFLIAMARSKEFRIPIAEARKGFVGFAGSEFEVKVDEYFPYAVVENNRLVSRSNEPVNPAVHLTVRKKGQTDPESTEKHTIFANFPEFSTLHGAHSKKTTLGIKFRMEVPKSHNPSLAIVGNQRGHLAFAQNAEGTQLFYRTQGKDGQTKAQGEIKPGVVTPTGWMDLQFKIQEWLPHSVDETVPRSIEYISGSGDNYLSAIHLTQPRRGISSDSKSEESSGWWLFEGQGKLLNVGGRELFVQFTKKKLNLPFYLYLEKFKIGNDPGTTKAASYESDVIVKDASQGVERKANISMNEPIKYGGYTFYQASYSLEDGRPPVSVFSVNFDPGRQIKYWGSLIMVLGILVMFYMNPQYLSLLFKRKGQPK
ncbi:MAG: cytochrome c biogenesis protein ResB, partial [Deltaproteobacteria bacterium]